MGGQEVSPKRIVTFKSGQQKTHCTVREHSDRKIERLFHGKIWLDSGKSCIDFFGGAVQLLAETLIKSFSMRFLNKI